MKTTEQEMAGILAVLNGRPTVFGQGEEDGLLPTSEVAAALLGKTVQQMQQDKEGTYEIPPEVRSAFEAAHAQVAEAAENQSVPYYVPLGNSKRLLGRLLGGVRRMARRFLEYIFAPILQKQNAFNASATRALEAGLKGMEANTEQLREMVDKEYYQKLKNELLLAECRYKEMEKRFGEALAQMAQREEAQRQTLQNRVERGYVQINRNMMQYFAGATAPAARPVAAAKTEPSPQSAEQPTGDTYGEIDYLAFENAFRGSEEEIRKNQESYLPYLAGKQNVLDIGCGRGEFLELLQQNSITATGVDTYPVFVEMCEEKGLQAKCMDGIAYLASLPDNSLGAVTAFQVAEHLPTGALVRLVELAQQKLEIGGVLILETPNPTNLSTFTNAFYVDPSHTKPVHPATLAYFADMAGFRQVDTIFTETSRPDYRLPLLHAQAENLAEFNDGLYVLNEKLFGSQDYAVIAVK